MKFTEILEDLKKKEENINKIVIAKCGAFLIAIGNDAKLLNEKLGLKLNCLKPGLCKIGIPVSGFIRYMDKLERLDLLIKMKYNSIEV